MLDSNTHYLNMYEHNQSLLEAEWELSLPEKREAVIEYTKKILKGDVSQEEYNWVFSEYYENSDDGDVYSLYFIEALSDWNCGNTPDTQSEETFLRDIVHTALSCASEIVYDVEVGELFVNAMQVVEDIIYDN